MGDVTAGAQTARPARRRVELGTAHRRKSVDALAMYAFIALGLPDGMLGTAWPSVRRSFHVPLEDLGVVLLAGTVGAVALSAVSGLVIAWIGIARTVMLGGAMAATGAIVIVLSPAFWTFVLGGAAIGLSAALIDGSINSAIALAGRNRLLNLVHGSYGIGTTVGPLVVTGSVLLVSWRPAYGFLFVADTALVAGWWLAGRQIGGSRAPSDAVPAAEASPVSPPDAPPTRRTTTRHITTRPPHHLPSQHRRLRQRSRRRASVRQAQPHASQGCASSRLSPWA